MDHKQRILEYIRLNCPSLPMRVAKALGLDTIIASAYLAELTSQNKVHISNLKIGGSPLYYLPNMQNQLEKFSEHLSAKEKDAFSFIKSEKVVKDSQLTPQLRVAMALIKDFAKPIVVEASDGAQEKYWKWYYVKNEEISSLIKQKYYPLKKEIQKEANTNTDSDNNQSKNQNPKDNEITIINHEANKKTNISSEEKEDLKEQQKAIPQELKYKEQEHEKQKTLIENNNSYDKTNLKPSEIPKSDDKTTHHEKEQITNQKKSKKSLRPQDIDLTPFKGIDLSSLPKELELEIKAGKIFSLDEKQKEKITSLLLEKGFEFELGFQDKKGKEIFGFARLLSAKKIRFFISLLKGKRISDKDLALAFLKSSAYSLPLLVLYSGTLSKPAQEILAKTNIEIIKI